MADRVANTGGWAQNDVSHQDIIDDADGSGLIMFNDKTTSGTKQK